MPLGRRKFVLALGVVGVLTVPANAFRFRSDPPAGFNGSPASVGNTCILCHAGVAGTGSVQILGVPNKWGANQEYDLTVRIQDPVQVAAGFQLSVEDAAGNAVGTLIITDAVNTQANGIWVNHTSAGIDNSVTSWSGLGNAAEYNVRWKAPAGVDVPVTFWAAGAAIDNDGSSGGDLIYVTSVAVGPPIPAASAWGLLAMTLMMLSAGSVFALRRQPLPVPARN